MEWVVLAITATGGVFLAVCLARWALAGLLALIFLEPGGASSHPPDPLARVGSESRRSRVFGWHP